MDISFWHMAFVGVLIVWTSCTFLRAVAARTHMLRKQLAEELEVLKQQEAEAEPDPDGELTVVSSEAPGVAAVLSHPDKKPDRKPATPANGKHNGKSNGKSSPAGRHGR